MREGLARAVRVAAVLACSPLYAQETSPPIIDMHLHAVRLAGFEQLQGPAPIPRAIAVIEDAPFLSAGQKRAVLYDNAARFLRLSEEEIVRHHRQ